MNKDIINKMMRLWDPYKLIIFPYDEYNEYATMIFTYYNSNRSISMNELTDYVFSILKNGLKSTNDNNEKNIELYFDLSDCKKFTELFFAVQKSQS